MSAKDFEWDEAKRLRNLEKHGYDFEDVTDASPTKLGSSLRTDARTIGKSVII